MRLFGKVDTQINNYDRAQWLTPIFDLHFAVWPPIADAVLTGVFGLRLAQAAVGGGYGLELAAPAVGGQQGPRLAQATHSGRQGHEWAAAPQGGKANVRE